MNTCPVCPCWVVGRRGCYYWCYCVKIWHELLLFGIKRAGWSDSGVCSWCPWVAFVWIFPKHIHMGWVPVVNLELSGRIWLRKGPRFPYRTSRDKKSCWGEESPIWVSNVKGGENFLIWLWKRLNLNREAKVRTTNLLDWKDCYLISSRLAILGLMN